MIRCDVSFVEIQTWRASALRIVLMPLLPPAQALHSRTLAVSLAVCGVSCPRRTARFVRLFQSVRAKSVALMAALCVQPYQTKADADKARYAKEVAASA